MNAKPGPAAQKLAMATQSVADKRKALDKAQAEFDAAVLRHTGAVEAAMKEKYEATQ